MRLTADLIGDDHDEKTGRAIYLLLAEQIAGQALALAAYRGERP